MDNKFFFVCVLYGEVDYLYFIPVQESLASLFSLYLIAAALFSIYWEQFILR